MTHTLKITGISEEAAMNIIDDAFDAVMWSKHRGVMTAYPVDDKHPVTITPDQEPMNPVHEFFRQLADTKADFEEEQRLNRELVMELDQLKAHINSMKNALDDLIENSSGVEGLHLNGDIARWSDLKGDGRFCEWLSVFDDTPKQSLAEYGARVIEKAICLYTHKLDGQHDDVSINIIKKGRGFIYPEGLLEYADKLQQKAQEPTCDLECGAYGTYCKCKAEKAQEQRP